MSILKGIVENSDSNLINSDKTFIDADTLQGADNKRYRIQGINAPEVEKVTQKYGYQQGQAGGAIATDTVRNLANDQGFTEVRPLLDADGNPQEDDHGRIIADLINPDTGESFKSKLLETGVFDPTAFTTNEDRLTSELGQLRREQNKLAGTSTNTKWDEARKMIEQGALEEQGGLLAFKQTAVDEAQLAAAKAAGIDHFYDQGNVQVRSYDRTISNKSRNPFSDSWDQGWIGVKESAYGIINLLGDRAGIDSLQDIGEAGVERARTDLADYGDILTDWKEVEDIGTAFSYITNNAALSLPYMAITVGGTLAAPVTGGVSLAAPAAIYAGQTWNEMEGEKNAGIAIGSGIAQAALDRLGLGFLFKTGVAPTKLLNSAVSKLVAQGIPKDMAKKQVFSATRKEIGGFMGDVVKTAQNQLKAKAIFKDFAKRGLIAGGGEAVTEGLQEATGYLAATLGSDKVFNYEELNERVLAGVIAGGALGKTFSVPGSIYNAGAWADVAFRQAPADLAKRSQAAKFAEQETREQGRIKSIEELNAETAAKVEAAGPNAVPTTQERIDRHKAKQKGRSIQDQVFDAMVSIPSLWRGSVRNIFTDEILNKSRAARVFANTFGGTLQKTFSGSTYENAKHHKVSIYKNMVSMPEKIFSQLNGGKRANRFKRGEISTKIYNTLNAAIDPNTKKFNPDLIPDTNPDKQVLIQLQGELERLANQMHNDQSKHNPNLGKLNNYLLRYKSFNKKSIKKNKIGFVAALKTEFPNMTDAEANEIADSITNSTEVNDIGEALDATQAGSNPGSHKQRTLNLAERDAFKEFMEQDIFANASAAAKSAARYTALQEYTGKNNANIDRLLQDMQDDGVAPEIVDKVAKQFNDYLLAESGNYKRPTSEAGKKLQTIQRNFMMVTTLAGLPLATISSFVEAALSARGLTLDQIFGKEGSLSHLGNELGHTLWKGAQEVASTATKKQVLPPATKGKEVIANLGFYDWDVGAATTTGATEINPWQQDVYEQFFKWTGLQGWTNYTRAVRGAIAGDYMIDKIQIIFDAQGEPKTNEVQEAEEALRNLGVNVQEVLDAYRGGGTFDPNAATALEKNFREGTFNFINDAVALPQAANRPLIYQDPRFALFTQFQGFIATFTANHIPKLWGEYVKRGSPAMKYNAFAIMSTMIMLGFASQYLKDLIKYGKPLEFGPGDHPFLNTSEYVQRGIRASGLLGTGERVLDQFFPLYESNSKDAGEWAWNTAAGESPALAYATKAFKGTGKLLEGDVGGAAKEASRFIPGLGVINFLRDHAQTAGNNWNFKG